MSVWFASLPLISQAQLVGDPSWLWWKWVSLVMGGVFCGFLNTLAGGGSLITLPLLIFLGLPPTIANATNRLALVVQYATSVLGFVQGGTRLHRASFGLAIPGLLGSWCGAYLALWISPEMFRQALGVLLLVALVPIFFRAQQWLGRRDLATPTSPALTMYPAFFAIGVYSGFIQVGVGVWSLLVLLGLGSYDINRANALKALLLFFFALLATLIFVWHGKVWWAVGGALAGGNVVGAWIATRVAHRGTMPWLRWLLLVGVLGASLRLLGVL